MENDQGVNNKRYKRTNFDVPDCFLYARSVRRDADGHEYLPMLSELVG